MTRALPDVLWSGGQGSGSRFLRTSEAGPPNLGPARPDAGGLAPEGPRMLEQKPGPLDGHEHSGTLARVSFHDSPSEWANKPLTRTSLRKWIAAAGLSEAQEVEP